MKTIFLLILTFVSNNTLIAQNLIREGNFENGLGSWDTWVVNENDTLAEQPTASANFSSVNPGLGDTKKALFVEVNKPGKYEWYIGASSRISIKKDNTYEVYFRAISTVNRTITFSVFADIKNELPFNSNTIEISTEDIVYGPFKFYFDQIPSNPVVKLFFGGADGNVTIDEIVMKSVPTVFEIDAHNSIEDVIGDITLPHEGLPHGASHFDWGKAPRAGTKYPPDDWTAAIAWGQLYEWIEGNPAKNTRVQIRDLQMYYLSKKDNDWHELQKSLLVEGAAYVENFAGDVNKPADIRYEPDGSISVTAGDGYNFHFWPKSGRVLIPKGEVAGCFVTVQCRLILDDPNGIDDRDSARYLMGVGGDWWQSMTAVWDNWTTNWDMGIGRFRFVTKEWQGHNLITLSPEETLKNPPPLPKSTNIKKWNSLPGSDSGISNNFPNPFYDSTTIQYNLYKKSKVKLEIYNMEGKCISILNDEIQSAGIHKQYFNGSTLNGGTYFYKLTTDKVTETRKMMLLK